MITLKLKIDLMHDNPSYSEGHKSEIAVLTLKSVPELSKDGPNGQIHYGEWGSSSIYIGKELTGKYLIKRIEAWDKRPDHTIVRGDEFHDSRLQNPVGWFFDSRSSTSPFLDLYQFYPLGNSSVKGAFGMLDYSPGTIWSGVDWWIANA